MRERTATQIAALSTKLGSPNHNRAHQSDITLLNPLVSYSKSHAASRRALCGEGRGVHARECSFTVSYTALQRSHSPPGGSAP
jgi:hypothetical protein